MRIPVPQISKLFTAVIVEDFSALYDDGIVSVMIQVSHYDVMAQVLQFLKWWLLHIKHCLFRFSRNKTEIVFFCFALKIKIVWP